MAEETPAVRNKGMLITAIVLAVLVVVIYNIHVYQIKREGKGKIVKLLRVNKDMSAGDKITAKDLATVSVEKEYTNSFGNVVTEQNQEYAIGSTLSEPVRKDQWLLWEYITQQEAAQPSRKIDPAKIARVLEIDSAESLGDILRVGDRVNILAKLSIPGKGIGTYRIIEGIKVLAIGGQGLYDEQSTKRARQFAAEGLRSYRSVTIEIDPDVSLQLSNILSYRVGNIQLELRNPSQSLPSWAGKINPAHPELGAISSAAAPARKSSVGENKTED